MGALAGQVAWVTGAGSGIGRACAVALAAAGARVALTGRSRAPLDETASLVTQAGGMAFVAPADVSEPSQVAAAHGWIIEALGEVSLLVNNAGWNVPQRHWRDLSAESVQQMVAVNLAGPFLMVLVVLPGMHARGGGVLVHIASIAATRLNVVSGPAYTATKHGARAMSASLNAEEGIHGIRSICINPGEVATPLLDRRPVPPPMQERARMVQPEDVAATVVFCASLPPRACITDLSIAPTDDELYRAAATRLAGAA